LFLSWNRDVHEPELRQRGDEGRFEAVKKVAAVAG
jgi:hypothetical protein